MYEKKYIAVVAGRSGGHIIPGLTLAQSFIYTYPDCNIVCFTTDNALDVRLVNCYKNINEHIILTISNVPQSKNIYAYGNFIVQNIKAFCKSLSILYRKRPEKIIAMGGYVSIPVCLAAWFLRITVELYELNVVPGKAIKLLSYFATTLYVCFKPSKAHFSPSKANNMQYPVRFTHKDRISQKEALRYLGLQEHVKTLVIFGGSQGSVFINSLMLSWIGHNCLLSKNINIIHQTGKEHIENIKHSYKHAGISALVFDYRPDIYMCYNAADLVIARAGSGTLFELKFFNKSSIIIPLETAYTDHQVNNALFMAKEYPNIFTIMRQKNIEQDASNLFNMLSQLLYS